VKPILFFMMISADGYYERGPWAIDWHRTDEEFNEFAIAQLDSVDTLLFGRVTYEGMYSFWASPQGLTGEPQTAERMNALRKIVFSRTLARAEWSNTRLERDAVDAVTKLRAGGGKPAIVLGSSDLAAGLTAHGLIDEYRLMVNPVALGKGRPVLQGLKGDLALALLSTRTFKNGNVLLSYAPRR